MRFFWLKSKLDEVPELRIINQRVNFRFMLIEYFPAHIPLLQEHLFNSFVVNENELNIDGVLFYHKEGHYVFGNSPLVGWLRTFMLPEMLNIDVPSIHLQNKPEDYESLQEYLNSLKKKKKSKSESSVSVSLDISLYVTPKAEKISWKCSCDTTKKLPKIRFFIRLCVQLLCHLTLLINILLWHYKINLNMKLFILTWFFFILKILPPILL